ncbi:OsmC-like protein [compost metagenome]
MTERDMAAALQRVEAVLRQRPEAGLHDDEAALARWQGGAQVVTSHANGVQLATDLPGVLGGNGEGVTPGWLMRAALAACESTRIAMAAASAGIELKSLEVQADSRSDLRGVFGMPDDDGQPISAGPLAVRLSVRISAPGVPAERLRALVEEGDRLSPVSSAVRRMVPFALHIEVEDD